MEAGLWSCLVLEVLRALAGLKAAAAAAGKAQVVLRKVGTPAEDLGKIDSLWQQTPVLVGSEAIRCLTEPVAVAPHQPLPLRHLYEVDLEVAEPDQQDRCGHRRCEVALRSQSLG